MRNEWLGRALLKIGGNGDLADMWDRRNRRPQPHEGIQVGPDMMPGGGMDHGQSDLERGYIHDTFGGPDGRMSRTPMPFQNYENKMGAAMPPSRQPTPMPFSPAEMAAKGGFQRTPLPPAYSPTPQTSPYDLGSLFGKGPRMGMSIQSMPFGGFRAAGGPMYPGYRYRVGEQGPEEVQMMPDGTAHVKPIQADPYTPGGMEQVTPRQPESLPVYGSGEGDTSRPPWNRSEPNMLPSAGLDYKPNMEPSPYSDKGRERLDDNATEREKALYEIQDLQRSPAKRESSIWKRIGSGVLDGLQTWAQSGAPGGLAGAIGAMGTGAAMFGASKGIQGDFQKRQELQRLFGRYGQAMQIENAELDRSKAMADLNLKGLDAVNKQADYRKKLVDTALAQNSVLIDQLKAGKKTPEEIAAYLRSQNIPAIAQDIRELEIVYDAKGQAVAYPKTAPEEARPIDQLPIDYDKRRSPVTVTPVGGKPVTGVLSDKDKMATLVGIQESGARMQQTQENQRRLQANADRDYELRKKNYELDVQKEERIKEEVKRKAGGEGSQDYQEWSKDLQKAKEAVEAIRREAELWGGETYNPDAPGYNKESERNREDALRDLAEKERRAMALYMTILNRQR